ncbi:MAG TPA: hypothetical protein VGF17_09655, partial [Phytomonospora sp.]
MTRPIPVQLTDDERMAISAVVHQNYYMPDVFAVVEKIIADRRAAAVTTQQYVFRARSIAKETDGDTYWLNLDKGMRDTGLTEIRLLGFDTPETRKGSAYERAQGKAAAAVTAAWLERVIADPALRLWVRTEPDPDDFGRWLGETWAETADGTKE